MNRAALNRSHPNHSGGYSHCVLRVAVLDVEPFHSIKVRLLINVFPEFATVHSILWGNATKMDVCPYFYTRPIYGKLV